MSSPKVLLIFGAGPRVGLATIKKFSSEGYKVAAVSRNPSQELKDAADLIVSADLKDPAQIKPLFEKVVKELGPPHVVVYNAYDVQMVKVDNPITVSPTRLTESLAVNTVSPYTAAYEAIKYWRPLPNDGTVAKTFLFTGNMTTTQLWPMTHSLGIGKNATAYWIETAATAYNTRENNVNDNDNDNNNSNSSSSSSSSSSKPEPKPTGKFYYVDERRADGESVYMDVDAEAHAHEFWRLSEEVKEQSHWNWTFVSAGDGTGKAEYVRNRAAVDREYRGFGIDFDGFPAEGGLSMEELLGAAAENEELRRQFGSMGK